MKPVKLSAEGAVDGRRNRSIATRKKIVAALTELVREGILAPTAEQVSARAKVGLRTVFRHFDDMETLYREMNSQLEPILQPAQREAIKSGTWQERLHQSVVVRAGFFEKVMPFYISTLMHRHESPYLHTQVVQGAKTARELIGRLLPQKLSKDRPRFEAIVLVLSIDAWLRLRREQGLSVAAAIKTMQTAVHALIADADESSPKASEESNARR